MDGPGQVISVLAGIFFRNEQFAPIQLLGAAIILAGVWGVNQGKKKAPANLWLGEARQYLILIDQQ